MQFRELTDRYQLQKILKSSRFGTVLRATDVPSGRTVAVKLITVGPSPGLAAGAPEFEKLATTLAGLEHLNLPAVLDFGFTTDGSAFLVLELLEGRRLGLLSGAPPARVLSLVGQALDGLEALAGRGLAHRNVSPDNLFVVGGQGEQGEQVKLLGLGTAVFRPRGPALGLEAENARFQAPELTAAGIGSAADWRADVYSLGLTTCHALGATVGSGDSPVVQFPLAVSFELENDEALRQGLERALRQRPGERPMPRELRAALHLAAGKAAAPAEPEEVLSAVDDEILNALLAVPPPPPRPATPSAAGEKGKVVPFLRPAPSSPASRPGPAPAEAPLLRRPAMLAAIAGAVAVVALGVLTVFWLCPRPRATAAIAAPAPAPVTLPRPPAEPPVARFAEAKLHLAQGEDREARRVLSGISFGEQGLLAPAGCRELGAVEETLAFAALERLPADLVNALRAGDLEGLQGAVEAGAGQEAGLAPEVRADLERARSAVAAYALARTAAAHGDPAQALESLAALAAVLPKASDPEGLRAKAALALETQAETLAREARYAEALARLAPLQRTWPDRTGLKERITRYDAYQRSEREQEALLAALPQLERRKKPWDSLRMLTGIEPTPHLAPRFAQVRARLEDLLARLDKQPPRVVLRDGYLLEYARGTVAELSFRATDDYEVKDVKLMARPQGGKFRGLPLEKNRAGYYTVEISPAFHQNGDVDLYVVATDLSGHEAALGSRDQPLQLKRKQGFERLIR